MQAALEAEAELAVGFFGARYDRATPAERDYMTAMADLGEGTDGLAVSTADVGKLLGRKPQSLSPARDGLIKKGLVFSGEQARSRSRCPTSASSCAASAEEGFPHP
jgi:hypothetical protein